MPASESDEPILATIVPPPDSPVLRAPPAPPLPPPPKTWHAGTLTYTLGGLVRLFTWLLWGDFAWSMKERSVNDVVKWMLRHFHASNLTMSLFMGPLPGALNLVLGPIVSYRSDRHRGRWGRRRPFLFVGVPLAALAMIGMAAAPFLGRGLDRALGKHSWGPDYSTLLFLGVFWMLFDVASVIAGSVFGAFFNDVVPREVMGRFYGLVRAISIGAAILFMGGMLGRVADHYVLIFVGIGLLYGVGFMASCVMVPEGQYPPPEDDHGRGPSVVRATITYFRDCFGKPYYLWVFAAMIVPNTLAFASIYTWTQYFATSLGLSLGLYGRLTALYFIISLPLAPVLGWLADKFHPLRVAMVALALHIPAALLGGLFIHDGRTFAIAFLVTGLLQVVWGTATAALGQLLLPKATFAQYSSAAGVVSTLLGMAYLPMMGWLMDYTHDTYRYTFLLAGALDIVGLVATVVVYRKFVALGGAKGYVAP
jgi:MFS family permease